MKMLAQVVNYFLALSSRGIPFLASGMNYRTTSGILGCHVNLIVMPMLPSIKHVCFVLLIYMMTPAITAASVTYNTMIPDTTKPDVVPDSRIIEIDMSKPSQFISIPFYQFNTLVFKNLDSNARQVMVKVFDHTDFFKGMKSKCRKYNKDATDDNSRYDCRSETDLMRFIVSRKKMDGGLAPVWFESTSYENRTCQMFDELNALSLSIGARRIPFLDAAMICFWNSDLFYGHVPIINHI